VFFALIFTSLFLWAYNDEPEEFDRWKPKYTDGWNESEEPAKEQFRLNNRTVELGIANTSLNATLLNNVFKSPYYLLFNIKDTIKDPNLIWQDTVVFDTDNLFDNFQFFANALIQPLSLNFNWKDKWGIGFDIGRVNMSGNLSLSKNMMSLNQTDKETFGMGAAVFADVGIPIFFHVHNFKIKLRPAVYLPIVYTEPGLNYHFRPVTNEDGSEGVRLELIVDMRVYTIVNFNEGVDTMWQDLKDNMWNILKKNTGYDFGLNIEYPWMDGLDLGVDVENIPVPYAGARLNHNVHLEGKAYFDSSHTNASDLLGGELIPDESYYFFDDDDIVKFDYDSEGKIIYRPFTMLFYAVFRPYNSELLSFIPSLGFSISRLYTRSAAIEGGLSARLNLANMFITTFGINYNDRKWKNSIDFAFNFRAIELDIGLSMQSPSFINSWRSAGLGFNAGVKLGW
jgi:hypothetical protein